MSNVLQVIVRRWESFWFPEASPLRLAICRLIMVGSQLVLFREPLGEHLMLTTGNEGFHQPQAMIRALGAVFSEAAIRAPQTLTTVYWVTIVAGVTTFLGLFTRLSAFVFAVGNWFLVAHRYSYGEKHHPEAIFCIFLLLLAFSPSGRCLSLDSWLRRSRVDAGGRPLWGVNARLTTAIWPLLIVQVLLALAYFCAGVCKLYESGPAWMNGYTLQQHIFIDAVRWDCPAGIWLAQQHELCIVLSVFAIAFELLFFLAVIFRRLVPIFLIGGVGLHLGIYMTQAAPFFQLILLYAVFIDFDRIRAALLRKREISNGAPLPEYH
ncbi:MAG: HTTM domain-containing protein [Phycisphaerales bacterium]|nr:MAG: HTTM domain-containing protein [Phycisphaerales bacterium]